MSRSDPRSQALRTLGRRLHEANAGLMLVGDRVLAPLGVTSAQWKLLAALQADGPRRISDLVTSLRLDQAATSRLVDRLERAGFVSRRPSEEDRREVQVALTERGVEAAARCRTVLEPVMRALTEDFQDEQLVAFAAALEMFAAQVLRLAIDVPRRRLSRTTPRR